MTVAMAGGTTATSRARAFSLSGRRRERAAGERLAALFEEHGRMVYGVCRSCCATRSRPRMRRSRRFLSAYRALLGGQEPREPSAWLGTIARNECRTRLRARRTEPLTLVREPVGDELQREVDRHDEIQALCAALAELPPQQRDAIVLREFYGLSYAEVGAALGCRAAAVESVIFRSRKRLQDQLRPARSALGVLTLPLSLRDSLAQAAARLRRRWRSAGAGAAVLAKLASAPVAAKVAAAALAVGAAGTVAGVETDARPKRHHRRHAARAGAATPSVRGAARGRRRRRSRPRRCARPLRRPSPTAGRCVTADADPASTETSDSRSQAEASQTQQRDSSGQDSSGSG